MTARAIGVFALVLVMASPALAGPENSVIGAKKLEQDMVHSGGTGYPTTFYEWWNKGKKKLDWGLSGDLAYGNWGASSAGGGTRVPGFGRVGGSANTLRIGLGINGILRWHLASKEKPKVTNDTAFLLKPGLLIGGGTASNGSNGFLFGLKIEVGAPFTIDVHERVTVVTGGFIPFTYWVQSGASNGTWTPLLIRMGVEIKANENIAPWFYFDLGPGIATGMGGGTNASFAWRIGAGTAFWGVLGKNKNKSDSAATASSEPAAE